MFYDNAFENNSMKLTGVIFQSKNAYIGILFKVHKLCFLYCLIFGESPLIALALHN